MHFKIDKKSFEKALQFAMQAVSPKNPLPVLSGISIKATKEQVEITGSNLDTTINCKTEAEIIDEGEAVFPTRLYNLVRLLQDDDISIIKESETSALVKYRANYSQFQLFDIEDYPVILEPENPVILKSDDIVDSLKKVAFAASNNEIEGIFSGVLIDISPFDGANIVATDRHRLNWCKIKTDLADEISVIIPKKSVNTLLKLINKDVKILIGDELVKFELDDIEIYTRTIAGRYPDYAKLLPSSFDAEIIVNKNEFIDALIRASIVKDDNGISKVQLYTKDNYLYIHAEDTKSKQTEKIKANYDKDINTHFNTQYLLETLKTIEKDEVSLKFVKDAVYIEEENFSSFIVGIRVPNEEKESA